MIKDVLNSISEARFFAIAGLLILLALFVAIVIWTLRLKKSDVNRMKQLPLDSEVAEETKENG